MMIFLGICAVILLLSIAVSSAESNVEYVERVSGRDLDSFFDDYMEKQTGLPTFKYDVNKGIFFGVKIVNTTRGGEVRVSWKDDVFPDEVIHLTLGSEVNFEAADSVEILSGIHTLIFKGDK